MTLLAKDRFQLIEQIGEGSFGVVYRALDKKTNKCVALKCIKRSTQKASTMHKECEIMKILQDQQGSKLKKYTVQMLDSFSEDKCDFYVLELLHSDIHGALKKKFIKRLNLKEISMIGYKLCKALCHMQNVNVSGYGMTSLIHGDLKLNNVMFTDSSCKSVKIIDFGMSTFQHETQPGILQVRSHRAPEGFFLADAKATPAVDMWSVGVILLTLFTNMNLFKAKSDEEQIANLVQLFGEPSLEMMEGNSNIEVLFDRDVDKLILKPSYAANRTQMFTFSQLFKWASSVCDHQNPEDPWAEKFKDLLDKMFQVNPRLRLKPQEAVKHPFFELSRRKNIITMLLEKIRKWCHCFNFIVINIAY